MNTYIVFGFVLALFQIQDVRGKYSYDGYHVIEAVSVSEEAFEFLHQSDDLHQIDVWHTRTRIQDGRPEVVIKFHAHPVLADDVIRLLRENDDVISVEVVSFDLQRDMDQVEMLNERRRENNKADGDDPFDHYYTFDELQAFLTEQVEICGSNCEIVDIGTSFQGLPLNVIKMVGESTGCQQKPSIWIDAGIHAREWIAVSTGQFLLHSLINEYDTDPFVKTMRDTYDWYILPCVNPDGYSYSWTSDRLWRKTRQNYDGVICVGADCNRNYDFQWMTVGASSEPCASTFAGPEPHSEPESAAQAAYMMDRVGIWDLFITLHTYGQLWMAPYGYTTELPANYDSMERVGLAAVETIFNTSGKVYQFGSAASILYQSSGTSRDWAAGVPQIPYVYTLELRDESSFELPPTEIRPTGEEIWAALKTTVDLIMNREMPPECRD
jgi:hypothetical protein